MKEEVHPPETYRSPQPISTGIRANGLLITSGQVGRDVHGRMARGLAAQTRQALENVKAIVEAAGGTMEDVVKVTIYLTDVARMAELNAVYREYFPEPRPARTTIEIPRVGLEGEVEIEAWAVCR